jgi:multisubunit Na+/H+ antiporter MnhB subunit
METKHPDGSVQAISSASIALLALLIAYIGYTSLKNPDPWRLIDLFIQIIPCIVAAISLAMVPWLATRPRAPAEAQRSIRQARGSFLFGALAALTAMLIPLLYDFVIHHNL